METYLGLSIQVAVVGLLVLLVVLVALAGIVYLLTRFVVDKKEEEQLNRRNTSPHRCC